MQQSLTNTDYMTGRLVALPSTVDSRITSGASTEQKLAANTSKATKYLKSDVDNFKDALSIEFPCMPETIELARSTEYNVNTNMFLPDGMHQYMLTRPLEIPFSFKLHFMSDYCLNGARTLVDLASRLHSFTLPISTFKRGVVIKKSKVESTDNQDNLQSGKGQKSEAQVKAASNGSAGLTYQAINNKGGNIYPPVTCLLELMYIDANSPGIACIGYVKDVRVIFRGPWNRGPNKSFNLPTSAEYSFTFVHNPGHANALGTSTLGSGSTGAQAPATATSAFANDVLDKLYNTRSLTGLSAQYIGLEQ